MENFIFCAVQTGHFRPLNVESIKRKHKNIQLGAVDMR